MKEKILNHLLSHYKKTGWNFVGLAHLRVIFGDEGLKEALNELWQEGYIEKREGVNQPLIELIKTEK
ncbi:MAG: hypothetical protein ACQER7_14740 [Bacteroidota bacterium]